MLIVTYDIGNNKTRTRLSKYLTKFGFRLQYSVYQIRHTERMLSIIQHEIQHKFAKHFQSSDSIIIFQLSQQCKIHRYGYAKNDENDLILIG